MNLIAIPDDELDLARAYVNFALGDSPEPQGEDFVKLVARAMHLRASNVRFLRELAKKGQVEPPPADVVALREFRSEVCPACGGHKRGGEDGYWFCNPCWKKLETKTRQKLMHGFRGRDLATYWGALHWLKEQLSLGK